MHTTAALTSSFGGSVLDCSAGTGGDCGLGASVWWRRGEQHGMVRSGYVHTLYTSIEDQALHLILLLYADWHNIVLDIYAIVISYVTLYRCLINH